MGLKMILQCLPESPFKDTASQIIGEAVAKLDEQEKDIIEYKDMRRGVKRLAENPQYSRSVEDLCDKLKDALGYSY